MLMVQTWFIKYNFYRNVEILARVTIIKPKVLLPQA
jgi:hypothetical protein